MVRESGLLTTGKPGATSSALGVLFGPLFPLLPVSLVEDPSIAGGASVAAAALRKLLARPSLLLPLLLTRHAVSSFSRLREQGC